MLIFDLDHTLIDSSHRQLTKADGSLDLEHWRENCTREKILQDSLTPLGKNILSLGVFDISIKVIACTARVMGDADYEFLRINRLRFDYVLSRPEGNTSPDCELKESLLRKFAILEGMPYARMMSHASFWDDNETILEHFAQYGTRMLDPKLYNRKYS